MPVVLGRRGLPRGKTSGRTAFFGENTMNLRSLAWLAAVGGVLTVATTGAAQPPEVKPVVKSALVGLPGVYVHLTEIAPAGASADVSPKFLRQTIEDRLKEAGIRVLSREELASTPGTPILEVQFCLLRHETLALYQYSIETVLWEKVALERNRDLVVQAVTWRSGVKFGNALGELLSGRIQDVFDYQIGRFVHDYDAANHGDRPVRAEGPPTTPGPTTAPDAAAPSPNDVQPQTEAAPPAPSDADAPSADAPDLDDSLPTPDAPAN